MRYKSAADLTYFGSTPFGTANKLLFEGRWDIARGKSCRANVVLPEPAQSQLERRRSYVVYFFDPSESDPAFENKVEALHKSDPAGDMHAGERETSTLLYLRPDLVEQDRATQESGANLKRWAIPDVYTAIWWYAGFPNHYAGQAEKATRELGALLTEHRVESLVRALKAIKADAKALELQEEFFDRVGQ